MAIKKNFLQIERPQTILRKTRMTTFIKAKLKKSDEQI